MEDNGEEFMLPFLPTYEPTLPAALGVNNFNHRKRTFLRSREPSSIEDQLADAITTSSDPALFSCDETPDAENYAGGAKRRKKKTYEGTWWGDKLRASRAKHNHTPVNAPRTRRFERNLDSGIFMVDDSSTDLSSEGYYDQHLSSNRQDSDLPSSKIPTEGARVLSETIEPKIRQSFQLTSPAALKRLTPGRPFNPKDHLVQAVVQKCLDDNDENVDWTGMGLDSLPPAITELRSLIKRINSETLIDQPAPFEAELRVYMGNNHFSQLPRPLLELTNIRLLSLRQNVFEHLPPGIRSLVNLEELNISSNKFQCLPYEILQLLRYEKLKTVHKLPNPWMSPPAVKNRLHDLPCIMISTTKHFVLHRCIVSKPIEFLPNGAPQRRSATNKSRSPHLSEVVLRALSRHNTGTTDLSQLLSEDHPPAAKSLLALLHRVQTLGSRMCTFCNRSMVLPRYEWYEWWAICPIPTTFPRSGDWLTVFTDDPNALEKTRRVNAQFTGSITYYRTGDAVGYDDMLPFKRMACGCVDVKEGLRQELPKFELSDSCVLIVEESDG